ncbi:MAG: hypothetical protein AAB418_07315, partial [candidate division NC10 bacterium]
MVPPDPEETFKVSDRRRRASEDEPPGPAPAPSPGPEEAGGAQGAPPGAEPERSLVGLFMMLASSAVISLGDAPAPVT